jgi:hypothetical protein
MPHGSVIGAADEPARSSTLDELVARAVPLIEAVVSRYANAFSSPEDLRDVAATAMMRLVHRLGEASGRERAPILRFNDFVAKLAFNTANDLLRERFPARTRLKNRIRYVLGHSSRVTSWRSKRGVAAGLSEWRDSEPAGFSDDVDLPPDDVESALVTLFHRAGAAILLDDVVETLATSWNIVETEVVPIEPVAASAPSDERENLAELWSEIRAMRPNHRAALLLNLRDRDSSAIELFILIGVATIDELAAALEMTAEELAAIWNSLPLDDNSIAARLGVTRQKVINFRRAARDRLARRLGFGENS